MRKNIPNLEYGLLVFALVVMVLVAGCSPQKPDTREPKTTKKASNPVAGAAALVNGTKIMEEDVTLEMAHLSVDRNAAIDSLINKTLIREAAEEYKIKVYDQFVDNELAIRTSQFESAQAYQEWLTAHQYTAEQYRESIRDDLFRLKLGFYLMHESIVSEADAEKYLGEHESEFGDSAGQSFSQLSTEMKETVMVSTWLAAKKSSSIIQIMNPNP